MRLARLKAFEVAPRACQNARFAPLSDAGPAEVDAAIHAFTRVLKDLFADRAREHGVDLVFLGVEDLVLEESRSAFNLHEGCVFGGVSGHRDERKLGFGGISHARFNAL